MALPIVTTDSLGCNDVVNDSVNGFLVPVRDPAALAKAIRRLIEQPELWQRFGRIFRQRAVEQFTSRLLQIKRVRCIDSCWRARQRYRL